VTHADPGIYDPENALRLARRAADLSGGKDVAILDALAAAYAAAGRFAEAARTAEDAVALAEQSAPQLADNIRARLARYRSGRALVPPAR
jgi:Flp pilus assembly protein TadD